MTQPCKYEGCSRNTEEGRSRCRSCRRADKAMQDLDRFERPGPRILFIDIETTPNLVYTWGLFNQNIGINQIVEPTRMLCFAAKWAGEADAWFFSEHTDGRAEMVEAAWSLLDEADVVVHYYGSRFDVPHLNREFLLAGLTPPSPYKQIDLKHAVAKRFKFPSNKLQFVSTALGLTGKEATGGFELWAGCMAGDAEAWHTMQTYNERDVTLLEEVYEVLLPWIPGHPHRHLYDGMGACPTCGMGDMRDAGFYRTKASKFRQYRCAVCGSFFRSTKREGGVAITEAVA